MIEFFFKVCELAGPGFDLNPSTKKPQSAAQNVACIHTSSFAGTNTRLCHQDWMLGSFLGKILEMNSFDAFFIR